MFILTKAAFVLTIKLTSGNASGDDRNHKTYRTDDSERHLHVHDAPTLTERGLFVADVSLKCKTN
jgi:hypothetical protein